MRKRRKTYKEAHSKMRKRQKGYRRKGIDWDYNADGQFYTEKMDSFFKRYWRKWQTRQVQKWKGDYPESGT